MSYFTEIHIFTDHTVKYTRTFYDVAVAISNVNNCSPSRKIKAFRCKTKYQRIRLKKLKLWFLQPSAAFYKLRRRWKVGFLKLFFFPQTFHMNWINVELFNYLFSSLPQELPSRVSEPGWKLLDAIT